MYDKAKIFIDYDEYQSLKRMENKKDDVISSLKQEIEDFRYKQRCLIGGIGILEEEYPEGFEKFKKFMRGYGLEVSAERVGIAKNFLLNMKKI